MSDSQVKFKVGEKVLRVDGSWNDMVAGDVAEVVSVTRYSNGETALSLSKYGYGHDPRSFKLSFTKSDLKDGMKIVLRNPTGADKVRYILGKNYLSYDQSKYCGNGGYGQSGYIIEFNNDLTMSGFPTLDIMEVYERDGTLLWKRVEKSQQEIEMDKLQKQIAELQEQVNKLKAAM